MRACLTLMMPATFHELRFAMGLKMREHSKGDLPVGGKAGWKKL